jgi:hypothetical protein
MPVILWPSKSTGYYHKMNIRKLIPEDRAILTRMILDDPDHRARGVTPEFFDVPQPNKISLCFEDDDGPVFYVRFDCDEAPETVRVHIQFDQLHPLRTGRTLVLGFEVVKDRCLIAGAKRLVFDSISATLREFCMRRFGFQPIGGTADLELLLTAETPRMPK